MRRIARCTRFLSLAGALALPFLPRTGAAQGYHAENVQLLRGTRFHDAATGSATRDGTMSTVTLESLAGWKYGDSFFFVDLASGDFADGPAGRHRMYGEWSPRLSLSRITGRSLRLGPVADLLLAASVDRGGDGFAANSVGIGTDLRIPGVQVAQLQLYRRKDNFNAATWQATAVWGSSVRTGAIAWRLAGFADVGGTDAGTDVMTQPQLLLDLGAVRGRPGRVLAGVEWYLHRTPSAVTSAPQLVLLWSW